MRCVALLAFLVTQLSAACTCLASRSACQEVANSNLVFIGTVESMMPGRFLGQGMKVRFKIWSTFQRKEDSASHLKKDDDDDNPKYADVWNESGDCGLPFHKGETYLVYATDDEDTNRFETNICHRTERLSDAGEDLAYLYFLQNGGAASSRLEGFVTSDIGQLNHDRFHYANAIKSPLTDVMVELRQGNDVRYAETDTGGRFVFDGLAAGSFEVSVVEQGSVLSGPRTIHIQAKGCALTTFLVLTRRSRR